MAGIQNRFLKSHVFFGIILIICSNKHLDGARANSWTNFQKNGIIDRESDKLCTYTGGPLVVPLLNVLRMQCAAVRI